MKPSSHSSDRTSFPRVEDISDAYGIAIIALIAVTIVLVLVGGYLQDRGWFSESRVLALLLGSLVWSGCLILATWLVLRKYHLSWTHLEWKPPSLRSLLLWILVLTPAGLGAALAETALWQALMQRAPGVQRILTGMTPLPPIPARAFAWIQLALAAGIASLGHSLFLQGLTAQAFKREDRLRGVSMANIAFIYLLLFLLGAPVGLPFSVALMVTWGTQRTRTLLFPIVVGALVMFFWYAL